MAQHRRVLCCLARVGLLAIHVQPSAGAESLEEVLAAEAMGDALFSELVGAANVSTVTDELPVTTAAHAGGVAQAGTEDVLGDEAGEDLWEEVRFVDEEGDVSTIVPGNTTGSIRWCSEQLARCSEPGGLTVKLAPKPASAAPSEGACRFVVNASTGTATNWEAVVTDPPPGPAQWNLMRRLVIMARSSGARVVGPAPDELLRGGPMNTSLVSEFLQPPLSFPVALDGTFSGKLDTVILRIPAEWRGDLPSPATTAPCIAIVEKAEDCSPCAFPRRLCASQVLRPVPLGPEAPGAQATQDMFVVELQRPSFLLRSWEDLQRAEPAHSVCLQGGARAEAEGPIVLGKLQYYALPKVTFVPAIARVGIRTFLNPGWLRHLELQCENCSQLSRIAIRPLTLDPSCRGLEKESLATATAAAWHGEMPAPGPGGVDMASSGSKIAEVVKQQREGRRDTRPAACKIPEQGPCRGFAESSLALGLPTGDLAAGADAKGIVYKLESSRRLSSGERQVFFHHRSALCFYPDGSTNSGWLIGFTAVHMDSFDMQAFIGFVCFFGVALPLVCLATALLHHNKYELCKQHLHRMRLDYQRAQLDRELTALGGGAGPRRQQPAGAGGSMAGASSSSSARDPAARDAVWTRPRGHILAAGLLRDRAEATASWHSAVGPLSPLGPALPRLGGRAFLMG